MGVHWNRTVGLLVEGYLWGFYRQVSIFAGTKRQRRHTYGIHLGEVELETIDLIFVKRILVEHLDVDEPVAGNAVVSLYQCDPRRHSVLVHLWGTMSVESIHVLAYEGTRLEPTLPSSLTKRLSRVAPAMVNDVQLRSSLVGVETLLFR